MIKIVTYTLQGQTYTLEHDANTGQYTAQITAPEMSSWYEPDHQFTGTLTATNRDDIGIENTVTQSAGFRVLEQDAPSVVVRDPSDLDLVLTVTPTVQWVCADTESGIDPDTVTFRVDGELQAGIALTPSGRGYLCQCTPEIEQGVHTLTFDVLDNDGNRASAEITVAVYLLIMDRTEADVERARYLCFVCSNKIATPEEYAEFDNDLKGAYNASDLNRVGTVVWFLHLTLERYGYSAPVTAKRDWKCEEWDCDIPTPEQMAAYIEDIRTIRNAVTVLDGTPEVPADMIGLTHEEANDIETILYNTNYVIKRLLPAQIYSGEVAAGEV